MCMIVAVSWHNKLQAELIAELQMLKTVLCNSEIIVIRLHWMYEVHTIVTNDCGICP